jgi:hypothetical protein
VGLESVITRLDNLLDAPVTSSFMSDILLDLIEPFVRKALPAFEFARLAYDIADNLTPDQVNLRKEPPNIKPFLEEVLPIATFAKIWEMTGRHLTIEYFGPNHPYDAMISLRGSEVDKGFIKSSYYLEVTSAVFEHEHLEREALARDGAVFHDPNIHHVGSLHRGDRRIVSHATAEDGDTPLKDLQTWILSAIEAKDSHAYMKPSILIVRAEPSRPLALSEWSSLVATASPVARTSQFNAVVVVDWYSSIAHRLK